MRHAIRLVLVSVGLGTGLLTSSGSAEATPPPPAAAAAAAATPATPKGSEPAITVPGPQGDYLRRIHYRLHGGWTENFVKTVGATHPPGHPLNNASRQVSVALTIRWDGTLAEVSVKKSSGSTEFDRAALNVVQKSAPYALPTPDVVSDDSYAHLEWTFARDHRACAAAPKIVRADDPLEVSLPRLMLANRVGEALRRVGDAAKGDGDAGLDRFARLYLARTTPDSVLNVTAAMALAQTGDRSQIARLRAALASRVTVHVAARGLHTLGVDICDTVRASLEAGTTMERELGLVALHAGAAAGADVAGCVASLGTVVADARQPRALRLSALESVLTLAPGVARPIVMATIEDKDPAVRGAAILASVRKGAGRPEMYRLAPMLKDKAVEVRAAASVGMVRAGGDTALDQLYLLGRETDPRPGQGVAAELAHMSTRASAEFLGNMLKRNNLPVQMAAARALKARKDSAARTALATVKDDARMPHEVLAIAAGQAPAAPKPTDAPAAPVLATATEPVHQMLKEGRNHDAATWIVEKLTSLEPVDAIGVLGSWLRRTPTAAAEGKPAAPAPRPQTESPAAGAPEPAGASATPPTTSALAL